MLSRLRSTWLAGGGALLLVLSLTGIAAGATLVADTAETAETVDTTWTFEDIDGNGVDDDCQDVLAETNDDAVTAALTEADLDGDGTISVSEAAQTDWTGGPNCNHGGYVSTVAHGDDCDAEAPEGTTDESTEEDGGASDESTEEAVAACEDETDEAAPTEEEQAECEAPAEAPVEEPAAEEETPVDTAPNAHGKAVSDVAKSPAIGGKNCNHGGAVSEVAKKDHGDSHGNDAKKAAGKAHGKGKGHAKP